MRTHTVSLIGFGLGICLLVGAFITWSLTSNQKPETKIQTGETSIVATTTRSQPISLDTDSDGLKDWEEALWGTDPKNPDTDGDGTPDGEEVKAGRNPMKRGPSDKTESTPISIYSQQKFFIDYFPTLSPTINTETPTSSKMPATKSPLVLYGNAMALAFKNQKNRVPNELDLFNTTISRPTPESFRALQVVAESYQILSDDFFHITGPAETVEITKELSVSYNNLSIVVSEMSQQKSLSNTELFKQYGGQAQKVTQAILMLINFLNNKKVQFEPNDPGYMFITPR